MARPGAFGDDDVDCVSSDAPSYCVEHPGTGRRLLEHSPKRDHTPRGRVTNDKAATPRATLRNGLVSTTGGSASVPGCACDSMHPPPSPREPPVSGWDKSRLIVW